MIRSKWKLPFIYNKFYNLLNFNIDQQVLVKNSIILNNHINKTVYVYNGHIFIKLIVKEKMVGYRFGDFILTRKYKKFSKKKKK